MQVAVDGPAGSGKSTVCKILAEKYKLTYLDTGAMYRSAAWVGLRFGFEDLGKKAANITFEFSENGKHLVITYNGTRYDITQDIRSPEVSAKVSEAAANLEVRTVMTRKQQEYAQGNNVIMEGRDITTIVLPNADVKVYLTASAEERAKRRTQEWGNKDGMPTYKEVLQQIIERDHADSSRTTAPLKKADDAELLDTTGLTLAEVATAIGRMIDKKWK